MPNTSASGGYLAPAGLAPPLEDDALDDFLGDMIAGITALDRNTAVRPRWQAEPPNIPSFGSDWVAQGIVRRDTDAFPVQAWDPQTSAYLMQRHESLDLLCSFYGPNCQANGAVLRDGIFLGQNREALDLAEMSVLGVGDLTKAPELIKNRWVPRCDLLVTVRRRILRSYPVLTFQSAVVGLVADPSGPQPIIEPLKTITPP